MPDLNSKDLVKEKTRDMRITKRYKFRSQCHGMNSWDPSLKRDIPEAASKEEAKKTVQAIARDILAREGRTIRTHRRRRGTAH